jgi:hypothetical protein
LRALTEDYDDA